MMQYNELMNKVKEKIGNGKTAIVATLSPVIAEYSSFGGGGAGARVMSEYSSFGGGGAGAHTLSDVASSDNTLLKGLALLAGWEVFVDIPVAYKKYRGAKTLPTVGPISAVAHKLAYGEWKLGNKIIGKNPNYRPTDSY